MNFSKKLSWPWLLAVLLTGVAARFFCMTLGHNDDYDAYRKVAGIVAHGKNVYAETTHYNYAPVWFGLLHVWDLLSRGNELLFRCLLVGTLTLADIGIFLILLKKFGRLPAIIFFLNPISIIITGFHNMFDNLAVLLAMVAVLKFDDGFDGPVSRRKMSGLFWLGLSLMTKHVFFLFPLWLAAKQRGLVSKVIVGSVPVLIFLLSFAPFWTAGHAGIINNVFHYRSFTNQYFYDFFMPAGTWFFLNSFGVWIGILAWGALVFRKRNGMDSLLLYTALLVAASPAITNQYIAIPLAFVAVFPNIWLWIYTVVGTLHLCSSVYGLNLTYHGRTLGYYLDFSVYSLTLGLVWMFWRGHVFRAVKYLWQEIQFQIRGNR